LLLQHQAWKQSKHISKKYYYTIVQLLQLLTTCYAAAIRIKGERIEANIKQYTDKKHLKNVGPIRYCEPPHAHSPDVASGTVARRLRIDVHDNDNA